MGQRNVSGRQLKKVVYDLLQGDGPQSAAAEICRFPAKQAVNPLFLFLCSTDEKIKWHAVAAMGSVVCGLAKRDMESARIVMRRFMWNLNEESGGIGWGCPEAMGETMACSTRLADEYGCILASYIRPGGNFLEHEVLQRGVLWGIGRLAQARPDLLKDAAIDICACLQSEDANLRGLAAWAVGPLAEPNSIPLLKALVNDHTSLKFLKDGRIARYTIGELAQAALKAIRDDQARLKFKGPKI